MISLVKQLITQAAASADIPADLVEAIPVKDNPVLYPPPRLYIEIADESLTRRDGLYAILQTERPAGRIHRYRIYDRNLLVRVTIKERSDAQLETAVKAVLLALPKDTADEHNNLVRIKAERAVRIGYDARMVEVFDRYSAVLHITFSGVITRDVEVTMITDVTINPAFKQDKKGD
ncbi:MAG: hypothetical protein LBJ14_05515 [Desulfarculales bacterium]|jgi:hypothetical protein|nr:hypothetical protein [Desulfarculales bacterium]